MTRTLPVTRSNLEEILGRDKTHCEICNSSDGTIHRAREMMFGAGGQFLYRECHDCGCLSLLDVPSDLSRYYPEDYYSMVHGGTTALRKLRDYIYLSAFSPCVNWHERSDLDVMRRCKLRKEHTLLDVGCGAGHLLKDLRELGYSAEGVDPFVATDIRDRFGIRVYKKHLGEISGTYDLVLFQHSLEHMPLQLEVLRAARRRLLPEGACVVCIPVVGWAWRQYGINWSQLDAPRHLFLHTLKSFSLIAVKAGFRIERVIYDSDEFQFWASDLYRQGIPLQGSVRPSWMSRMQMRRRAEALNQVQDGDKAQFYMRLA
jgi:SAM-dependent methyltransferase